MMAFRNDDNGDLNDEGDDNFTFIANMVITFGYITTMPFLLVTFIVYTILPELRNTHGLTLRGYVGCQLVGCIAALVLIINRTYDVQLPCILSGFIICSSLSGSYFWLNVMCFDIWWTFRESRPLRNNKPQPERKKCIIYSIYVWGWMTFSSVIWAIVEFVNGDEEPLSCLTSVSLLFIVVPISVTLFLNMILFILTVRKMIRHNKDTLHHLKGSINRRQDNDKQWFTLYLKLFIVMGINWSLQIISWFSLNSRYITVITSAIAAFQGIITFVLFICKKRILRSVMKRCHCRVPNFCGWNSDRSCICHSRGSTISVPPRDQVAADSSPDRF